MDFRGLVWKRVWKMTVFGPIWDRVSIWRTWRHTPTKNYQVYPLREPLLLLFELDSKLRTEQQNPWICHWLMPAFIVDWTSIKKDALERNDKLQSVWLCLQALAFEASQAFPSFTADEFINWKLIPFFDSILIPVKCNVKIEPRWILAIKIQVRLFLSIHSTYECWILIIHFTNGFLNKNRINSLLTTGDAW